ncbi:MAG TPA: glycosyltransferase [candidate division Zixibacteria bacterium]|nr:glycosyltransferase [candidate division Zixibacteria bacterium]
MKMVVFGLSITSSWGNGHATTFRALLRALHERGHDIVFFEKDVEWYASNRDLPVPGFCQVRLYERWSDVLPQVRNELEDADVAMVGSYFPDGLLAMEEMRNSRVRVKTYYDIDTPITVSTLRERGETEYLRASQISGLDVYFSFTGGPMLTEIEERFGARRAVPLYCSVDPDRYFPRKPAKRFVCEMSYMGTYAPDRQPKLEQMLFETARQMPERKFLVAGPQYPKSVRWPQNVRRIRHLNPRWHPHLYSSSRLTLNITRRDMVMAGYSPSVRLFEAAACGATIVSDAWPGLESFFLPGREILVCSDPVEIMHWIHNTSSQELRGIGEQARRRVLAEHTNRHRAEQFETAVSSATQGQQKEIKAWPSHAHLSSAIRELVR